MSSDTTSKPKKSPPDIITDELLVRLVAGAYLDSPGVKVTDIARRVNTTVANVKRIQESERFKEVCKDIGERELGPALARAKIQMSHLSAEALKVISYHLKKKSLQAALAVLKGIGIDQQSETVSDSSITIVLPGAEAPKTITTDDYEIK